MQINFLEHKKKQFHHFQKSLKSSSQTSRSTPLNNINQVFNFPKSQTQLSEDQSNFFWRSFKWLKNHVDLIQMSVLIFLFGNIISIPISHAIRVWNYRKTHELTQRALENKPRKSWSDKFFNFYNQGKQSNQVDVFTGLRNDIALLILGFLTYTLPVLAFDKLGQTIGQNQVVKAIKNGELEISGREESNNLCGYLGGLIGLILGLITNDLLKSSIKPIMEQFIGKQMLQNKEGLSKIGFNTQKLNQELTSLNSMVTGI
ncbi:MAG: hypothetical protein SFU25_02345 [Candidatus Caenarcaniphilales bacterium]|nr:hypothetical protein [Candidatus Caenarcaniphilales bacterium]